MGRGTKLGNSEVQRESFDFNTYTNNLDNIHLSCLETKEHGIKAQISETPIQILEHIKEAIQLRLAGMQGVAMDIVNQNLCKNWDLSNIMLA